MKVYNLFIFTVLLLLSLEIEAQDPHFSQFFSNPLLLNPALAGTSNGKYRVSSTYRDQWRSAIDEPLKTYTVSGDMSFSLNERSTNNPDKFAFGFNFFGDRVSQFDLNTTEVTLYGAYHKALDDKTNQYLSAGIYVGVAQKNINYEDLTFEDQFNSIDGYTLPGGEFLPINNFGYGDIGIGINYTTSPSPGSTIYAGIAMYHINNPNISFYKSDQSNNTSLLRNNTIDRKLSFYLATSFSTTPTIRIEPRVLYLKQGQSSEVDLGTNFRLLLNSEGGKYLHFGPWLRMVDNFDGFGLESIVASIGLETGSFLIGFSYDHSLDDLTSDRLGLNAFELSLTYYGDYDNGDNFCPKF